MPYINLPYGQATFNSDDLIKHIRKSGRNYIIQGGVNCVRGRHPKKLSLDVWLRDNYARHPDVRQAVSEVIADLVDTGDFEIGRFPCPESGKTCQGIRLVQHKK